MMDEATITMMLENSRFFAKALIFEMALGVAAILLGKWLGQQPLATLQPGRATLASVILAVLWGVAGALPLVAALFLLDRFPVGPFRTLKELTDRYVIPLFAEQQLWQLALLSAAAGFGEETLFRGLIQAGLAHWLAIPGGELIACVVAAVLFGLCHWLTTSYAILATLMGLYFGWLFLITDSLLVPIVTHALYDFVALAYFVKQHRSLISRSERQIDHASLSG